MKQAKGARIINCWLPSRNCLEEAGNRPDTYQAITEYSVQGVQTYAREESGDLFACLDQCTILLSR